MNSFVLVRFRVDDPEAYARYRTLAGPSVVAHGGWFLLKGAVEEHLEGDDFAANVALIAFGSSEDARAWFASDAYSTARTAREGAGPMMLTLLSGTGPPPQTT